LLPQADASDPAPTLDVMFATTIAAPLTCPLHPTCRRTRCTATG
jgi:hypothetical protein